MTDSITTPVLDSYPLHKDLVICVWVNAFKHPLNKSIFETVIHDIIDVIGDDDLYFELQELYEKLP